MQHTSLVDIAQYVLSETKSKNIDAADVSLSRDEGFSVRVREGATELVEHHLNHSLSLTVYDKKRSGNVSISDFSKASLQSAVEKACSIAKFTQADEFSGLPDKEFLAFDYPDCDLYHPWDIRPEQAIELALQCDQAAHDFSKLAATEGSDVHTYRSAVCVANSLGFVGEFNKTSHGMSCEVLAKKGKQLQRDYEFTSSRLPEKLMDPKWVGKNAAEKAVNRLGAKTLKTQNRPVLFTPTIAKSIWSSFIAAISGRNLYRDNSFLNNALNSSVFPKEISIYQDPHLPRFQGSKPFDGEGVRTKKIQFIENGILKSYALGSYSGRKLKMPTTGNAGGVFNLFIQGREAGFDELLQELGTGLMVTELIGQGVNILTGDYSRGAFGYWVEKGKIQYPVEEITIAGNLKTMFQNIIALGDDIDHRGNVHSGSLLISEMTVAGE